MFTYLITPSKQGKDVIAIVEKDFITLQLVEYDEDLERENIIKEFQINKKDLIKFVKFLERSGEYVG